VADDRGAPDFLQKAFAKDTANRPAGVVRAYTEKECSLNVEALEQIE
jgi:hypothetical protein